MEEKISVIVPVYNVKMYLQRCIDSLLRQTYQNYEVLLIDDCSTDGSELIARQNAEKYPNIFRYIQRKKNGGSSAARNMGMREAQGEWYAFVDSDDWVTDDYLTELYHAVQENNADIAMSSVFYYYSENNYKEVKPFGDLTTSSSQKEKVALCRPYAATRLFRKSLFVKENIEFPEDIKRAEDIGTIVPIMTKANKIACVQKPMYFYFQRATSLSNMNESNMDISFYPRTVKRMVELSNSGFETELEFRVISELLYGMNTIMIRSGAQKKEICQHIDWVNNEYPNWKKNPYLPYLAKGKRIFIYCSSRKWYLILKTLIWAWDRKQARKRK